MQGLRLLQSPHPSPLPPHPTLGLRRAPGPPGLPDSPQVTALVAEFYSAHPQEGPLLLFRWVGLSPAAQPSLLLSWGCPGAERAVSQAMGAVGSGATRGEFCPRYPQLARQALP